MSEICFNVWYYLDSRQHITAIAAKAYLLDGSDAQKGAALQRQSGTDYLSVVPRRIRPVDYSLLKRQGVDEFFALEFDRIEQELAPACSLPEDKLYFATPLFDFGEGFVPAQIGDGFIAERH